MGQSLITSRETKGSKKPYNTAVDIWAVGVLALQLLSGYTWIDPPSQSLSELEKFVQLANRERAGKINGPISQNGIDFILACLELEPRARPTAAQAAKHLWLRESAQDSLLFKEREKHLTWKPRGIVIPAIVRLDWAQQHDTTGRAQKDQTRSICRALTSSSRSCKADDRCQDEPLADTLEPDTIPDSLHEVGDTFDVEIRALPRGERGASMALAREPIPMLDARCNSIA